MVATVPVYSKCGKARWAGKVDVSERTQQQEYLETRTMWDLSKAFPG
jgi:hypothetical protein